MAVQQWVLPYLELIAGTLAAVSRKPVLEFASRFLLYTSFGSCLNFMALLIRGQPHWWDNVFLFVMFQVAFTLQLAFYAVLGEQFRNALAGTQSWARAVPLALALALTVLATVVMWGDPHAETVLVPLTCSILHAQILCLAPRWLPQDLLGHVSWVWLYTTRLLASMPRPLGPELHLGDLFLLAYCAKLAPMRGQEVLGKYLLLFWPFLPVLVGILLIPGTYGRKDQQPWPNFDFRLRMYTAEWIAVAAFLCIPQARDVKGVSFPSNWLPHLAWLRWWALWAFVSHKALYYLLDGLEVMRMQVPWYVKPLTIYVQAIPFYYWFRPKPAEPEQAVQQEMT